MYTFRKPTVFQPAKENKTSFTTPQKKTCFSKPGPLRWQHPPHPQLSTLRKHPAGCFARLCPVAARAQSVEVDGLGWWIRSLGILWAGKKTITSLTTEAWYSIPRSSWIVCFLELGSLCTASICAVSSFSLMIRSRCGWARMLIHRQRAFIHPKYIL